MKILIPTGAFIMLWRRGMGLPILRSAAEWLVVSGGLAFAFSNVFAMANIAPIAQANLSPKNWRTRS